MSDKEEITRLKSIKKNLLKLDCPHIDITEDDIQINTLLLENSNYRQDLIKWLLETLIDSVEFDVDETLQSLGLDLKTLTNWELALKLVEGKKKPLNIWTNFPYITLGFRINILLSF